MECAFAVVTLPSPRSHMYTGIVQVAHALIWDDHRLDKTWFTEQVTR